MYYIASLFKPNTINKMKNLIHQTYSNLNTQLNEWYQCMPYEALSEIHHEDVYGNTLNRTSEDVTEILDELRVEWFEMSTDDKMECYVNLNEKYESYFPQKPTKENILSLYSDDFDRSHIWEDVCEIVGANPEYDNVSIKFTSVLQFKQ